MLKNFIQPNFKERSVIKNPIGIFGGTFDPIHLGHLENAKMVREIFSFDCIHFIPCYQPYHRSQPFASAEDRLHMLKIATHYNPHFLVNTIEYQRKKTSFTVETLEILRKEYPDTPLCFIIGMDSLIHFTKWHRWKEILDLAHLIVLERPTYILSNIQNLDKSLKYHIKKDSSDLYHSLAGSIVFCPMELHLDVSSTKIRETLAAGKKPDKLPLGVYQYIKEKNLYSIIPEEHNEKSIYARL